jgi:membrane-associated protein
MSVIPHYKIARMNSIQWSDLFGAADRFLEQIANQYGALAYATIFAIVFCETGLVFLAFLPGDSLLFVAGAISAGPSLKVLPLMLAVAVGATLGNALNFAIGGWLGHKVYDGSIPWIDRSALDRTHAFFERHGGKTVLVARFIPIVRSFAPLVAGASGMRTRRFHGYSVAGAVLWSVLLVGGGFLFGNVPGVKENLGIVLLVGLAAVLAPVVLMTGVSILRRR